MGAFPRLSQRVAEPRLGLGRPAWVEAPDVDLDWHVARARPRRSALRRGASPAPSASCSPSASTTPARCGGSTSLPLTGGRVAVIGRIHHAMADGVSAIRLTAGLLWDEDSSSPAAPSGGARRPRPGSVKTPPEAGEARILVRLPAALWRELRPGRDTKLDQHIGPAREVAWTSFPARAPEADRARRSRRAPPSTTSCSPWSPEAFAAGSPRWAASPTTSGSSARSACTRARRTPGSSATATRS